MHYEAELHRPASAASAGYGYDYNTIHIHACATLHYLCLTPPLSPPVRKVVVTTAKQHSVQEAFDIECVPYSNSACLLQTEGVCPHIPACPDATQPGDRTRSSRVTCTMYAHQIDAQPIRPPHGHPSPKPKEMEKDAEACPGWMMTWARPRMAGCITGKRGDMPAGPRD